MRAMKLRDTGVARCVDEDGSGSLGARATLEALLVDPDTMAGLHRTAERYARVHRGSWEAADLVAPQVGGCPLDVRRGSVGWAFSERVASGVR